jgi:hypothetical protein
MNANPHKRTRISRICTNRHTAFVKIRKIRVLLSSKMMYICLKIKDMQIYVKVKQAGKRSWMLAKQPIQIADIGDSPTLKTLLIAIVTTQVQAFNDKILTKPVAMFLADDQIQTHVRVGKVGFGAVYRGETADLHQAIQQMLIAFEDGLYAVAVDEQIIQHLDTVLTIHPEMVVMFLKLSLLSGW